jgi:large subunit ribosomal protein L29
MKVEDIKNLGDDELVAKLADSRHELMNLRFQMVTGQLTDTSRLKQTRRLIARFETILHQRKMEPGQEGGK